MKDTVRVVCNTFKIRKWRPSRTVKVDPDPFDRSEGSISTSALLFHNAIYVYEVREADHESRPKSQGEISGRFLVGLPLANKANQ